jgi:hypothetical protein
MQKLYELMSGEELLPKVHCWCYCSEFGLFYWSCELNIIYQ